MIEDAVKQYVSIVNGLAECREDLSRPEEIEVATRADRLWWSMTDEQRDEVERALERHDA